MRAIRFVGIVLLHAVVLASGCGARKSNDPDAGQGALNPVTVTFDPAGTTASMPGPKGSTLTLDLPPGAVRQPVDVVITPLAPTADAPFAFTLSPSGLQLRAPATLTLQGLDIDPATATATWLAGDVRSPVQATVQGSTLTATVLSIGPLESAPTTKSRSPRSSTGSSTAPVTFLVNGVPMPCADFLREQTRLGEIAMTTGAPASTAFYWSAARSLAQYCPGGDAVLIEEQQRIACEKLAAEIENASVVAADSYRNFLESAGAIIAAQGGVQIYGGTCAADPTAALEAKVAQVGVFFRARLSSAQLTGDLEAEIDMIDELLAFDGACQLASLDVCQPLLADLYPVLFDSIRAGAWDSCQQTGAPLLLGVLFGDALGGSRPVGRSLPAQGSTQPYMTFADFTYADLEDDISSCATRLDFHRFIDEAVPDEVLPAPSSMLPGAQPGTTPHEASMDIYDGGSLTITGKAPLPHCPGGGNPSGALVARVIGKEVGRAPAGTTQFTLDTRPFSLKTSDLQAAANGATHFDLDLVREGAVCATAHYTSPWVVARLHLNVVPPPVPDPIAGTYHGTGVHYSENGCGACTSSTTTLTLTKTATGYDATFGGLSSVAGIHYAVALSGNFIGGDSCSSCAEPLTFVAKRTGSRLEGFAQWAINCGGPGCKVTFDVTHD